VPCRGVWSGQGPARERLDERNSLTWNGGSGLKDGGETGSMNSRGGGIGDNTLVDLGKRGFTTVVTGGSKKKKKNQFWCLKPAVSSLPKQTKRKT